MKRITLLLLFLATLASCSSSNDGRLVKKFLSRINAREYNSASQYIFPNDHPKLAIYQEVLEKNPNTFLKLIEKNNVTLDNGQKAVAVSLQCINPTPYYKNYMKSLNLMDDNDLIRDTIPIKETLHGDKLGFNWAKIDGDNLELANTRDSLTINIHQNASNDSKVLGILGPGERIIINNYPANSEWLRCFRIDENCNLVKGYVARYQMDTGKTSFFSLSIVDTMTLLVSSFLFVVLGFGFFLIRSVVEAIKQSGCLSWIIAAALVVGWFYVLYQLLEKILFELFIINLPY